MKIWLRLAGFIDSVNERMGRAVYWLALAIVVIGTYNSLSRYLGRFTGTSLSSNAYIELQWYLFSVIFLLGAAYTLRHNAHVRVDVLYARLSKRSQNIIDLVGAIVFLLPFCVMMIWLSMPSVLNSWSIMETSPDPGGLPRYPIKTLIPLAFGLLAAQGLSQVIKNIARLRGHAVDDNEPQKVEA